MKQEIAGFNISNLDKKTLTSVSLSTLYTYQQL